MDGPAPTDPTNRAAQPAPATPWALLCLLMAMTAIGPLSLNILVPAVPRLVGALATDTATVQLTLSLYLLGLATAQLLLGPLSDRFGRRPVVLAGLTLTTLSSAAAIAASSIEMLILARIAQALGASTGVVVGRAIIRDLFERDRAASMLGLVTTAMVVAPMVAPLIGGILDTAFGWEAIFVFLTVATLAVLGWAALVLPETRVATVGGTPVRLLPEVRALAASRSFAGYVLCAALGSGPFFVFIGGAAHVMVTMMGRTSAEYGVWWMMISIGYMGGNFTASRLSMRYGVDAMIRAGNVVGLVGGGVGVALVAFFPQGGPAIIFLPQLIISVGSGIMLPNAIAGAVSVRPHAAGAASGITGFIQMGMGAIGAQAIGHILAGAANPMPMAAMILGFTVATVVAFWLLVRRRA